MKKKERTKKSVWPGDSDIGEIIGMPGPYADDLIVSSVSSR